MNRLCQCERPNKPITFAATGRPTPKPMRALLAAYSLRWT
jgi:hypothetical protein